MMIDFLNCRIQLSNMSTYNQPTTKRQKVREPRGENVDYFQGMYIFPFKFQLYHNYYKIWANYTYIQQCPFFLVLCLKYERKI